MGEAAPLTPGLKLAAPGVAQPGHAVAVFQIRSMVAAGGVPASLKGRGFDVTGGTE
jgi:hypothetical protein